uniref:Putative reverse transcriptase domain-containing protein n=1 Tax=Tanacetum cinerariifolium TaxID=118510 RepID=A0A6L2LPJ3_TANCI|nr:putative reverse transcriptase domain-containing protein [Tanacetum cinerariifolium]
MELRFSKYETAQELWGAILKIFGGNEATKKTKKNQLKQQYRNFKAEGSETLEQTFNRLHAIVSHLEFMGVEIEQDDLNQKFLTSLTPEWLMYIIVWRNIDDLDTMNLDDVYNHLKVYEPEVQKKSESNSQNMVFISSANTSSGKGEVHTTSVLTASTQVSIVSADVAAASISHDTICAYIASQSNGSQIKYEDITQIDEDDIEEMNINYMANEEENHALVADDEASIEFALMAKSSSSSENEVEDRLVEFKTQEIKFCEKIRGLEFDVEVKNNKIEHLMNELEKEVRELIRTRRVLDTVLFPPPPVQVYSPPKKDMSWTGVLEFADDTIIDYSRPSPSIGSNTSDLQNSNSSVSEHEESSDTDIPTVIKTNKVETARKSSVKYAEMYRNTSKSLKVRGKTWPKNNFAHKNVTPRADLLKTGRTPIANNINDKGYWDSGCSRHMTGNISYLSEYEPYDGRYVSFGQGGGKITGKDFKLKDDTNVLLRTPRQHNMYSIDLNNIVPHKNLTCLVAKASADESMLWHRRLGINVVGLNVTAAGSRLMLLGKVDTAAKLKIHEKNYTTYDLRLGMVMFALKILRYYLYGKKSVIYIDHKSIQHICNQKEFNKCQRRWIELFSDYDCHIRYHPGKENVVADALSRKERIKPKRTRAMNMTF